MSFKFKNKTAIISGIVLATLDFGLLGGRLIYSCATNSPICGEGWAVMYLHMPALYLFWPLFKIFENPSITILDTILTAIAGIIQYFIIGYIIGYLISLTASFIAKNFKRSKN